MCICVYMYSIRTIIHLTTTNWASCGDICVKCLGTSNFMAVSGARSSGSSSGCVTCAACGACGWVTLLRSSRAQLHGIHGTSRHHWIHVMASGHDSHDMSNWFGIKWFTWAKKCQKQRGETVTMTSTGPVRSLSWAHLPLAADICWTVAWRMQPTGGITKEAHLAHRRICRLLRQMPMVPPWYWHKHQTQGYQTKGRIGRICESHCHHNVANQLQWS